MILNVPLVLVLAELALSVILIFACVVVVFGKVQESELPVALLLITVHVVPLFKLYSTVKLPLVATADQVMEILLHLTIF